MSPSALTADRSAVRPFGGSAVHSREPQGTEERSKKLQANRRNGEAAHTSSAFRRFAHSPLPRFAFLSAFCLAFSAQCFLPSAFRSPAPRPDAHCGFRIPRPELGTKVVECGFLKPDRSICFLDPAPVAQPMARGVSPRVLPPGFTLAWGRPAGPEAGGGSESRPGAPPG